MTHPRRASARSLRRFAVLLAILVLASLAPVGAAIVAASTPVTAGYRDIQYGDPAVPGGDDVTADRSQSKLWVNDGRWFGVLFDTRTTPNAKFRIWRFDMASQNWTNTGIAVDDRNRSHADVLASGNTVWVASSRVEGPVGTTGRDLRIYRYAYNATSKTYALASGFPKLIAGTAAGTGFSTIARDATGRLWVAFPQAGRIRITSSTDSGVTWTAPIDLPGMGNNIATDDVASIAALSGGGTNGVGILWSNQTATDDSYYFAAHVNGDAVETWQARETAFGTASAYDADGHVSLKTDASGDLIAAIKTGRNDDPGPNGGDPLIAVLRRTGSPAVAGTWSFHEVSDVSQDATRPILVLDAAANQANVFLTDPEQAAMGQQSIYRRTAPISTLNFGTPAVGTLFISSATELAINDATSTKQMTQAATGILVEATNIPTLHYLHGCAGTPCPVAPVANFTADTTTGSAPLTVQFTDTSTNTPTAWAWTFGDGGTSTLQNPSHQFTDPGTYTVSLTASNVAGGDIETKTGYITVSEPPQTAYFEIAPVRVLDTRPAYEIGLAGAFQPNVPRTLSIAPGNGIPADAVAITGNLTVDGQTRAGFLAVTKDPTANPTTSTLNFPLGDARANGVTAPLNTLGDLSIVYKASGGSAHVILDITGYFRVAADGATYYSLAPTRVLDSRPQYEIGLAGTFVPNVPRKLSIAGLPGIDPAAVAITANLTVVGQTRGGYLAITPAQNANPTTSSINFPLGDTRANGVTVPLNTDGDLWIVYKSSGGSTHVILDVTGYFLQGTAGATFVPVTPSRILDTRFGTGLSNPFQANVPRAWVTAGQGGVGTDAIAVIGNVTVVGQTKAGYVTLTPTNQANPPTSTLNFPLGDIRANNFTIELSGPGNLSGVYKASSGTTHLVVDVTGYYK